MSSSASAAAADPSTIGAVVEGLARAPVSHKKPKQIQPQPPLSSRLCVRCIKLLGRGCDEDYEDEDYGIEIMAWGCREGTPVKCERCAGHNDPCETIPPRWRRSANVVLYLHENAFRGDFAARPAETMARIERCVDYAAEWSRRYAAWRREVGSDFVSHQRHEIAEISLNYQAWTRGDMLYGSMSSSNEVIDAAIERSIYNSNPGWRDAFWGNGGGP